MYRQLDCTIEMLRSGHRVESSTRKHRESVSAPGMLVASIRVQPTAGLPSYTPSSALAWSLSSRPLGSSSERTFKKSSQRGYMGLSVSAVWV